MPRYSDILAINDLELKIRLGEFADERKNRQRVNVSCKFFYEESPAVAAEDGGTFLCYDKLSRHIHNYVGEREFRFIEHLVHALFNEVKNYMGEALGTEKHPYMWIKIDKLNIPVTYTIGSTSFTHSNLPEGAALNG